MKTILFKECEFFMKYNYMKQVDKDGIKQILTKYSNVAYKIKLLPHPLVGMSHFSIPISLSCTLLLNNHLSGLHDCSQDFTAVCEHHLQELSLQLSGEQQSARSKNFTEDVICAHQCADNVPCSVTHSCTRSASQKFKQIPINFETGYLMLSHIIRSFQLTLWLLSAVKADYFYSS